VFQSREKREINERLKSLNRHRDDLIRKAQHEIELYKASQTQKWEYWVLDDVNNEQLNNVGSMGWELVGITSYETGSTNPVMHTANYVAHTRYVFKRQQIILPIDFLHRMGIYDTSKIDAEIAALSAKLEGQ
jgi:hypothetical protein